MSRHLAVFSKSAKQQSAILLKDNSRGLATVTTNKSLDYRMRLVGILPLIFFMAQGVHYWRIHQLGHMLWMCNIGNLILAIGLFFDNRRLMRIAIIWTIPGLLIWFVYVVLAWGVFFTSTLAHVGGLVVGMFVLRRIGMDGRTWAFAFAWYLLMQFLSRFFTTADLNVNLAHRIQPGWEQGFGSYWQFWLVLTIVTALTLWAVENFFRKVWPVQMAEQQA
jgi:hypothetical protein